MRALAFLFGLLFAAAAHAQAPNIFSTDVQMCSGRPWIDVTCNGADPTGAADSTAAINTTTNAAITNGWPVYFPAGTYKITSKLTWDYQGLANNGLMIISRSAILDGRTINSGNVLQIQCSGGTTGSPAICNHLQIQGELTVSGSTTAYVAVLGKTDFSDQHNAAKIDHLVVTNTSTGGAIQANYLTDGDLWLSGKTTGGSSSVGAIAFEQVQTSRIAGYGSALGASAPALLLENGASVANIIAGFAYDPNANTCVSITSASALRNSWIAPYFPCTTAINAPTNPTQNIFLGPSFAGTNLGPTSPGVAIVGRGSLSRYSAPTAASRTLAGTDDGTIFSSANGTGASTQFTAASLPITLPDPAQVGAGWTAAFVSDNNKAVVLTASAGKMVIGKQQYSTLTVASAGASSGNEIAALESDGANFRVTYISQGAALLNGAQTALPAIWDYPGGPGYQATINDNGTIISSGATSGGLTVTLPSTNTISPGWMLGLSPDAAKSLIVQTNSTLGGAINSGGTIQSLRQNIEALSFFQFDGSRFRLIGAAGTLTPQMFGAVGDGVTDDTAALQAALTAAVQLNSGRNLILNKIYKITAGLTVPAGVQMIGSYHGPGHGQVNPIAATCNSGIRIGLANINGLIFNGDAGGMDGVCIDNPSISNTTGAAVLVTANNIHVTNSQIQGACLGLDVTSTGGLNNNVGFVAAWNTIIPANNTGCAGIRVGAQSTNAFTTEVHLEHNETYCNASNADGLLLLDGGGIYITGQGNGLNCLHGTKIFPGTNQVVDGVFETGSVIGDSSATNDLLIDTAAATGIVQRLNFTGSWIASSRGGPSVQILNSAVGNVDGIHFADVHILPAVANIGVNIVAGTNVTFNGSYVCGGTTSQFMMQITTSGVVTLIGNEIGICDPVGTAGVANGIAYIPTLAGIVTIADNVIRATTTPLTFAPSVPPTTANIHNNIGVDDVLPVVGSSATVTAPVSSVWQMSGTAAITRINTVWPGRQMTIYPTGAFSLQQVGGGNIQVPSTVTATVGVPLVLTYVTPNWVVK